MIRRLPLVALALLAGCDLAPKYVRPETPVPPAWPTGAAYSRQAATDQKPLPWSAVITDPKLRTLMTRALAENRDLRAALANVASARALYRVQRAEQLPTVTADAGASFSDRGSAQSSNQAQGSTQAQTSYSADIGISAFEIDLFGRVRNETRAALETYLATEEGARSTRIVLIGELATAYATLAADQDLLAVAQDTAKSAQRSLELASALNRAGLSGKLDVHQAETVLQQARSDVEATSTQVAQDCNALALLVGAPVEDALLPVSLAELGRGIGATPAGLPSEILLARPDVLAAEHRLRAAYADIGAARAAFFPRISLTAAIGVASTALSSLFSGGALAWSAAPSASLPIFGGGNRGNLDYSKAQRDLTLAQYEKAVQTAFSEVADGLARAGTIDRQQAAQRALVEASRKSTDLADQRYRAGIDTYLNVLDSQRTLYGARQSQIATELAAITSRIDLARALGQDENPPRPGEE